MHRGTVEIIYQTRKINNDCTISKETFKVPEKAIIRGIVAITRDIETGLLSAFHIPSGYRLVTLSQKWFLSCLREMEAGLEALTPEDITQCTSHFKQWKKRIKPIYAEYQWRDQENDPDYYGC